MTTEYQAKIPENAFGSYSVHFKIHANATAFYREARDMQIGATRLRPSAVHLRYTPRGIRVLLERAGVASDAVMLVRGRR